MVTTIVLIFIWFVCGFFAYGATQGYFMSEKLWGSVAGKVTSLSLLGLVLGPIGLIVAFFESERFKYGFRWVI